MLGPPDPGRRHQDSPGPWPGRTGRPGHAWGLCWPGTSNRPGEHPRAGPPSSSPCRAWTPATESSTETTWAGWISAGAAPRTRTTTWPLRRLPPSRGEGEYPGRGMIHGGGGFSSPSIRSSSRPCTPKQEQQNHCKCQCSARGGRGAA